MFKLPSFVCGVCGGDMVGDGYNTPIRCENADYPFDRECDAEPLFCIAKEECWDCQGEGFVVPAFHAIKLKCDRCNGEGECPTVMKEWQQKGKEIYDARISEKVQLKDDASRRGIAVDLLSKIERGIVNPDLYD